MKYTAIKIAVIESERGWGRKIDDWKVCLTLEDAELFRSEFNSENTETVTPDWYMAVEGDPVAIELNVNQYNKLTEEKRIWLSELNKIK